MPLEKSETTIDNLDVEVRLTKKIVVASGQTLKRGDLVELATGKAVIFAGGTPYTVMQEDVDASAGDVTGVAYRDARLKASEVNYGSGADSITLRDTLDTKNIFLMD